jgi:hypothetical protein
MFCFFIRKLQMIWRNWFDAPKLALRGPPMMTSGAKHALAGGAACRIADVETLAPAVRAGDRGAARASESRRLT